MSTSYPGSTPDGSGDSIAKSGQLVAAGNQQLAQNTPWMPPAAAWLDAAPAEEGLDLLAFLHSLRRKWLPGMLIGAVVASTVAGMLWFVIPVSFHAVGLLRVKRETREFLGGRANHSTDQEYVTYKQTQAALITSPYVLNAALRKPEMAQLPMIRAEEKPLAWLESELRVEYPGDSEILRIGLRGDDSEQPIKIVQATMEAYLEEIAQAERQERTQRLETLRREHRDYVREIQEKDEIIHNLAEELGTEDSELAKMTQRMETNKLSSLDRRMSDLESNYVDLQSKLAIHQSMMNRGHFAANPFDVEETLEKYPQYITVKLELDEMQKMLRTAAPTMKPGSPQMQRFQSEINNKKQDLDRIRRELQPRVNHIIKRAYGRDDIADTNATQVLQSQIVLIQRQLEGAVQEYDDQIVLVKDLGGYSSDLVTRQAELLTLQETATEIGAEIGKIELNLRNPPRIMMVQPALIPDTSNLLLKLIEMAGAWVIVFFLCVFGVAFADYVSKPLNNNNDVPKAVGLNVLGSLPAMRGGMGLFGGGSSREMAITDSVDSIRTTMLYGGNSMSDVKSIVVTSAVGGEGKSTIASQLAVSLARSGRRALLIDGDLRNPQQHAVFGLPLDRGLCEVLRGDASIDEVIQATAAEGLWIMPAGQCDLVSLQALAGQSVGAILDKITAQFDFVIVDSGPVLTGPEAMIYGQYLDGAVISTRRDVSRLPKVQEAFQRLQSVDIRVIGAVVNGTAPEIRPTKRLTAVS